MLNAIAIPGETEVFNVFVVFQFFFIGIKLDTMANN